VGALAAGEGVHAAVVADAACNECSQIDDGPTGYIVHGGGVLGVQYGVAALLEELGFRFFHPARTFVPGKVTRVPSPAFGVLHTPEQQRRGLHLHTLHPIEGYFDFWEPSAENLARACRVIDWLIANRGNYLEWTALNNIASGPPQDWKAHTQAILEYAHSRGVKVGIGIELYSHANLQLAFDLIHSSDPGQFRSEIETGLRTALEGLPFDTVNLSLGEFLGADPDQFVATVDLVYLDR